ncbi:programmed cell death protein 5-like [Ruditapes philippinarum]|uniref:programmed cell death protein 5-like n=1 Tax=Ruditapes philippinarum TaxID=129788 RepID=UPI00295BDB61|nr:programmed cell death protein 5-like [Ruditapes philippinarum]
MADDAELEAIRARRMAEMQAQMGGPGGGGNDQQKEKERQMEEMKHSILCQVLDQSARTRLNTIAVAKPEKAKMVESMLMQMAQSGQIQGKLNETQLKGLLERVNERTQKTTTVKFDRRRAALDSDSD